MAVLALLVIAGCGGSGQDDTASAGPTTGDGTTAATTSGDTDESSSTRGPFLDLPVDDLPSEECAGAIIDAEQTLRGARVVFIVDNSPSMYAETAEVQARLNGFADAVVDSGIDVRVAVLSAAATGYYGNSYVARASASTRRSAAGCARMPAIPAASPPTPTCPSSSTSINT